MKNILIGLVLFILVVIEPNPVQVRVSPSAAFEGARVRVSCRVDVKPSDRQVALGIVDGENSQFTLDELEPERNYQRTYRVKCGDEAVYCAVLHEDGKWSKDTALVKVACSDEE